MKKRVILISVIVLLISCSAFSQTGFTKNVMKELNYEVQGVYKRSVKKTQFNNAQLISDVISGYPTNWISEYVSVEILGTCAGKVIKAIGLNEKLTPQQKNILNTIDLAANIVINVNYNYKDPITHTTEKNTMHVEMTIVPEMEAEFVGGQEQLINYLKDNSMYKLPTKKANDFKGAVIRFTINEGGEIINAKTSQNWGDAKTDKLLIELINNMPKWRPAVNENGIKVKQDFVFRVGTGGC